MKNMGCKETITETNITKNYHNFHDWLIQLVCCGVLALSVQMIKTLFPKSVSRVYVFIPSFCQLVKLLMLMSFSSSSFWFLIWFVHFIQSNYLSFTGAWKYKCVNAGLLPSSVHISQVGWAAKLRQFNLNVV